MANLEGLTKFARGASLVGDVGGTFGKPIAAGIGLGIGLNQRSEARKLKGQAQKFLPGPEDPEVRNFYNLIQRKARAIETGTDPVTAAGKKMIKQAQTTTQGNIVRAGAGDPRKVLEGFKATTRGTGEAVSRLMASTYPSSQYYTSLGGQILGKISSRKFDLKMSQRAQLLREAGEKETASSRNISGALGFALPA